MKVLAFLLLFFTTINAHAQHDKAVFNNVNNDGVILDGYDPVAFFTDNKPVKGDPRFQFTYDKAIYYFSSKEHLDEFKSNPDKYKPQFGGWCAYAVSFFMRTACRWMPPGKTPGRSIPSIKRWMILSMREQALIK